MSFLSYLESLINFLLLSLSLNEDASGVECGLWSRECRGLSLREHAAAKARGRNNWWTEKKWNEEEIDRTDISQCQSLMICLIVDFEAL